MKYLHERNIAAKWFAWTSAIILSPCFAYALILFCLLPFNYWMGILIFAIPILYLCFIAILTAYRLGFLIGYKILSPGANLIKSIFIGIASSTLTVYWIASLSYLMTLSYPDLRKGFIYNLLGINSLLTDTVMFTVPVIVAAIIASIILYYKRHRLLNAGHQANPKITNNFKLILLTGRISILIYIFICIFYNLKYT